MRAPELPASPDEALASADAAIAPGDVVFAHSMGAVVVMRLLQQRPRPLRALVLTGSFFPPARNGRTVAATTADYLAHRLAFVRELRARHVPERRGTAGSPRALAHLLRQAAWSRRVEPARPERAAPVLVIHARDDHHVPVDFAIAAAAQHPAWTLRLLDEGGHHAHVDRPRLWLDQVLPWLDGLR